MERITDKDLKKLLSQLNQSKPDKYSEPGAYGLDYAYGGVKLIQYVNKEGGQRDISIGGFGTKRELFIFMRGMVEQKVSAQR